MKLAPASLALVLVMTTVPVLADDAVTPQTKSPSLNLSPFPKNLASTPRPDTSPGGAVNPMVNDTSAVPSKSKRKKAPVRVRGAATGGYGVGSVNGAVGHF